MSNMFRCVLAGGGTDEFSLTVTCSSAFAGKTITATQDQTTLSEICPSSSPYEVEFLLPTSGTWQISGTIGSKTYTESVEIEATATLLDAGDVNVTVYSAPGDTLSYTDIYGNTRTITCGSNGSAQATIKTLSAGKLFFFTSSIAKNPNNLSEDYSKAITISPSTSSIYVMPDKALYWYGFEKVPMTYVKDTYGGAGTRNTNNFTISHYANVSNNNAFFYTTNTFNLSGCSSINAVIKYSDTTSYLQNLGYINHIPSMADTPTGAINITPVTAITKFSYTLPNSSLGQNYVCYETNCYPQTTTIYALYVE